MTAAAYPSLNVLYSFPFVDRRPVLLSTNEVILTTREDTRADAGGYRVVRIPPEFFDVADLAARLPAHQRPDLFVAKVDPTFRGTPVNVAGLACPKVLVLGDTHHRPTALVDLMAYARHEAYDLIVGETSRNHLHFFAEAGFANVAWLPGLNFSGPDAAPRTLPVPDTVSFVGQVGRFHPYRRKVLAAVRAAGLPLSTVRISPPPAWERHARAAVSLNVSLNGDLNWRIFEVLACRGLLLTDRLAPEAGLERLFEPGRDLALWESAEDLIARAAWYLGHPAEAEAMRAAGHRAFLADHAAAVKAWQLVRLATAGVPLDARYRWDDDRRAAYTEPTTAGAAVRRATIYQWIQDLHCAGDPVSVALTPAAGERLAADLLDLPRLRIACLGADAARRDRLAALDGGLGRIAFPGAEAAASAPFDVVVATSGELAGMPPALIAASGRVILADAALVGPAAAAAAAAAGLAVMDEAAGVFRRPAVQDH